MRASVIFCTLGAASADESVAQQLAAIVNDIQTKIFTDDFVSQVNAIHQYNSAISSAAATCQTQLSNFNTLLDTLIGAYKSATDVKQQELEEHLAMDHQHSDAHAPDVVTAYTTWLNAYTALASAEDAAEVAAGTPATSTVTIAVAETVDPVSDVSTTLGLLSQIVAGVTAVVGILDDVAETSAFTSCATALKSKLALAGEQNTAHPITQAIVNEADAAFQAMDGTN